jgi:plastocyanin
MRSSVLIQNFAFAATTLTVKKGTVVTWTNNDTAPHTVTGDNGGPSSGNLSKGQSYSYTFDTVGVFPYHCTIHSNMKGTVIVTE